MLKEDGGDNSNKGRMRPYYYKTLLIYKVNPDTQQDSAILYKTKVYGENEEGRIQLWRKLSQAEQREMAASGAELQAEKNSLEGWQANDDLRIHRKQD